MHICVSDVNHVLPELRSLVSGHSARVCARLQFSVSVRIHMLKML